MSYKIKRMPSRAKQFGQRFGGTWKYDGRGSWWCDDGRRHISRVQGCSCDGDCNHPSVLYLYGDGIPKDVDLILSENG